MNILSCKNIKIKFGYKTLLSHINFQINSNDKIALTGVNGCGKTSFLRILAGLSKPFKGQVYCYNEEIWPSRLIFNEHFSIFLSSHPSLLLQFSVQKNLEFYCESFGKKFSLEQIKNALDLVGLADKIKLEAQRLSTGQKRRLTLAALYLIQPKIILADEPTNGLDEKGFELCVNLFQNLCSENKSALLTATHDSRLIQWCDQQFDLEKFATNTKAPVHKIDELL